MELSLDSSESEQENLRPGPNIMLGQEGGEVENEGGEDDEQQDETERNESK